MKHHPRQTRGTWFAGDLGARARVFLQRLHRGRAYPALGALLALGMPIGLLIVHAAAEGQWPSVTGALAEVASAPVTYTYVTIASALMLTILGALLGRWFDREQHLSTIDPLTGLLNRRSFAERLSAEQSRATRTRERSCLLCVDIDRLKAINDLHGHQAGDRALVTVAGALERSVRPSDPIARFGGDEFVVLLPESTPRDAERVARRILVELARAGGEPPGRIDVSIGFSELSPFADADAAMALADVELYRAKARGGRQVHAQGSPGRAAGFTLEQASRLIGPRTGFELRVQPEGVR